MWASQKSRQGCKKAKQSVEGKEDEKPNKKNSEGKEYLPLRGGTLRLEECNEEMALKSFEPSDLEASR